MSFKFFFRFTIAQYHNLIFKCIYYDELKQYTGKKLFAMFTSPNYMKLQPIVNCLTKISYLSYFTLSSYLVICQHFQNSMYIDIRSE